MKKTILLATFLLTAGMAAGQNALTVGDFTLPQNGGTMTVTLTLDEPNVYTSYQFKIVTPTGMGYVLDSDGDATCTLGTGHSASHDATAHWNGTDTLLTVGVISTGSALLTAQTVVLDIPMAATTAAVGTTHDFTITGITFIKREGDKLKVPLDDVSFTVTVGEPGDMRTELDETSTTAPTAATGVDVRVKRTIKANEWSTICLPFAMSAAQVKTAFGDDVQLADFTGYVFDDEAETITVNFKDATAIQANHPYIIKVSSKVEEFTIDGVDIDPEDEPMVNKGTSRKPKAIIGTYVANTVIENGNLFLSGNQFWYSVGNTKMKAFRAYFNFFDLLPDFEDNYAESRIVMSFGDETTGIESLTLNPSPTGEGSIYNLNGQRVEHPAKKGLYIKSGKKVVMK